MRVPPLTKSKTQSVGRPAVWEIAGGSVSLEEPLVMGILNVTPDSFSDGGELPDVPSALRRAEAMVSEGAGILDVGGESTRPGAVPVAEAVEIARVVPVVEALASRFQLPISVDTRKTGVARAALAAGAAIVNDVSGLAFDREMGDTVAESGAGVVLMHMRGTPEDMRERAGYDDVTADVLSELRVAIDRARKSGIAESSIVIDPGIGFAKNARQSLILLGSVPSLTALGFPVLLGPSRKSFLGEVLGVPPRERAVGTAAACLLGYLGGARLFRVHDVAPTVQALAVARAVGRELETGAPVGGADEQGASWNGEGHR